MSLIKDRYNKEWTLDCKIAFNTAREMNAKPSQLLDVIQKTFSKKEWDLLDSRAVMNGVLDSYIIDRLIDFFYDKEVNFDEVTEKILECGDFSTSEKRMFKAGNISERIWGIFLSLLPNEKRIENLK